MAHLKEKHLYIYIVDQNKTFKEFNIEFYSNFYVTASRTRVNHTADELF